MKKQSGRRSFLKKISIGSISAGVLPATLLEQGEAKAASLKNGHGKVKTQK